MCSSNVCRGTLRVWLWCHWGVSFLSQSTPFFCGIIKKKKIDINQEEKRWPHTPVTGPYRSPREPAIPSAVRRRNVRRHTLAEHRRHVTQCGAPHKRPSPATPRKRHRATSRAIPAVGGASTSAHCAIPRAACLAIAIAFDQSRSEAHPHPGERPAPRAKEHPAKILCVFWSRVWLFYSNYYESKKYCGTGSSNHMVHSLGPTLGDA